MDMRAFLKALARVYQGRDSTLSGGGWKSKSARRMKKASNARGIAGRELLTAKADD
jgi:hypothetical protein